MNWFLLTVALCAQAGSVPPPATEGFTDMHPEHGFLLEGVADWDGMGMRAWFLDDLTGDGVPEIGTSAFCTDHQGSNSGSLYVYDGATGAQLRRHDGLNTEARLGEDATAGADFDGDGWIDYIGGARRTDGAVYRAGSVFVWSGFDGSLIHRIDGTLVDGNFGQSVSVVDDLDGDGVPEVVVGEFHEHQHDGAVSIWSGATATLLRHTPSSLAGDAYGFRVVGMGDVTGDGRPDLAIGAPESWNGTGRVELVDALSGAVHRTWQGSAPDTQFGFGLARAGDVNGDGYEDLILGAPCEDTAIVVSAHDGTELFRVQGDGTGTKEGFGHAFAGVGDVDGDGCDDLAFGAPGEWDLFQFLFYGPGGRVWLVSGRTGALLRVYGGLTQDDAFGGWVAGGGDWNGDGTPDLLVGAPAAGELGVHAPGQLFLHVIR